MSAFSVFAQNEILDDFILKNHLVLVDTFVDEALTARKKYTKRKEFFCFFCF